MIEWALSSSPETGLTLKALELTYESGGKSTKVLGTIELNQVRVAVEIL